jgi:hypothetical protein
MAALTDLLTARSSLADEQVGHLQRLVGEWQLLADLSFADLLLWVPLDDGSWLCVAQCRPTTGPTAYLYDQVGEVASEIRAHTMRVALAEGRICRESDPDWDGDLPIRHGHRRAGSRQQPRRGAQSQPVGAGLSAERGRSGRHGRRRHLSRR